MAESEFVHILASTAAEVCTGRDLSPEAVERLAARPSTPAAFVGELVEADLPADAVLVLAHALPKREAVWWACACLRRAVGPEAKPEVETALKAAEAWTAAPGDVNRRKAFTAAEAVGFDHPAGTAAAAAFFSGGSLAPPNLPAVPPAEHLTGDCAAASIKLAALLGGPIEAPGRLREFVGLGLDVARGASRWKPTL